MIELYMWRMDAETHYETRLAGRLRVTSTAIEVLEAEPPLEALVARLRERGALPFRTERVAPQLQGSALAMAEETVAPGAPDYAYAFSQALEREGGYETTFSPEPPQ